MNIIKSTVVALSKWLHGEGSAHFRSYTYPRVKQFTRTFINLGIYEYIEKFYKIVDDTFYEGDTDDIVPVELVDSSDSGALLPLFSSIKDDIQLWKGLEQGKTYRCGTFTMNNMLRTLMLNKGLTPPLQVTAIDPLYIATKHGKGKVGTVMDNAFKFLAEKGYPMVSWSTLMTNHNKELGELESSSVIANALEFSGVKATGNIKKAYSFKKAVQLDKTLPENWMIQVSVSFSQSLKYFRQHVPYVADGSLKRTGGHSIHGVRHSFSEWEDGENGFAIIESAYRSNEVGWRFIKESLMQKGIITIRFVEFDVSGGLNVSKKHPVQVSNDVLKTNIIKKGQRGKKVEALQKYLMSTGISIPAGATGYFGIQTVKALKQWQYTYFDKKYDGTYWGKISQRKYKELIK